ncbi:exodeoxyribonuclease III [Candidatus Sororendozoicomonas aggregata]|uniref:exodeoxyribonuclease III n=1 Tax=Candidatus Sororendozoicomonas aggregata TaxID=3073239 RepID=UPI002ED1AF3A
MKISSFNVNGIRSRLHQLKALIEQHEPDVIGLQETKVSDEDFPVDSITSLGYQVHYHGQKTHYGVALLSKITPENICKGFHSDEAGAQCRLIMGDYILPTGEKIRIINGYFPQGESNNHPIKYPAKRRFYEDLQVLLETQYDRSNSLIVMGDFNISATDNDIGIGPENAQRWLRSGKCSFLPEEREWFQRLLSWGLTDCFRELYPTTSDQFSWFDYRSRGFEREPKRGLRIDGILATNVLYAQCESVIIDYAIRSMDKPSDHAPLLATFDL